MACHMGILIVVELSQLAWGFRRLLPLPHSWRCLPDTSSAGSMEPDWKNRLYSSYPVIHSLPRFTDRKAWYAKCGSIHIRILWNIWKPFQMMLSCSRHMKADHILFREKTMFLNNLRPDAMNLTTLEKYNITYVVRTDSFIWFDLSKHNQAIDQLNLRGDLQQVWSDKHVTIFHVVKPG